MSEKQIYDFLISEFGKDYFDIYLKKVAKKIEELVNPNCDGCIHIDLKPDFEPCVNCKRVAWTDYYDCEEVLD